MKVKLHPDRAFIPQGGQGAAASPISQPHPYGIMSRMGMLTGCLPVQVRGGGGRGGEEGCEHTGHFAAHYRWTRAGQFLSLAFTFPDDQKVSLHAKRCPCMQKGVPACPTVPGTPCDHDLTVLTDPCIPNPCLVLALC